MEEKADSFKSVRPKSMNDAVVENENPLLDRKLSLGAVLEGLFKHYEENNGKLEGQFNYSELTPNAGRATRSIIKENNSGEIRILTTPLSQEGTPFAKNAWESYRSTDEPSR